MDADQDLMVAAARIEMVLGKAYAGREMTISARIVSDPPADLGGRRLEIRDTAGTVVAELPIGPTGDDGVADCAQIDVPVPERIGRATWQARLSADPEDGHPTSDLATAFDVEVIAHPVYLSVWDLPSCAAEGDPIGFKVGVKCGAGCSCAERTLAVLDEAGRQIATAVTDARPWPGTEAMHVASFEIAVPDHAGDYRWRATMVGRDGDLPHEDARADIPVRVVPPPDITLTVEAVAEDTGEPLEGVRVVMHPYRAITDPGGIARVHAARGSYQVLISRSKYDPMSKQLQLDADCHERVVLVREAPEFNPDDNY
jgi:hypothetical protein